MRNGAIAIKAKSNGAEAWATLKLWQVLDAYRRNPTGAVVADLRFNLTNGPLEAGTNLAMGRIVADASGSLPAKLAALVDGEPDSEAALSGKSGEWVEVDLGRDRVIGEIRLLRASKPFWREFDIYTYATGQRASEAEIWAKEVDWNWTAENRASAAKNGATVISYRAPSKRFRYIRIVNRTTVPEAALAEIEIVPIALPNPSAGP
jgi:hypothetical protein